MLGRAGILCVKNELAGLRNRDASAALQAWQAGCLRRSIVQSIPPSRRSDVCPLFREEVVVLF